MNTILKNWKLNLLAIIFISVFLQLGHWQLKRAEEKKHLLHAYHQRTLLPPLHPNKLGDADYRFYRLAISGQFDNAHSFLLDNKTYHGKIGYELYTPFVSKSLPQPILVDRGFIPITQGRTTLPILPSVLGEQQIVGLLNLPPRYFALGTLMETPISWPLRIQYLNLTELSQKTIPLFMPYILMIQPRSVAAFAIEWQIVMMGPEKHQGYALQWFAFAITLLIISIALNWRSKTRDIG